MIKVFVDISKRESNTPGLISQTYYFGSDRRGSKVIVYNEIDEDLMASQMKRAAEFVVNFHEVEGFTYEFEIQYTLEETLAIRGFEI
jgi:Pyruvate/2-oxoacid:ferredoxin oxidoreductase gamma subunit